MKISSVDSLKQFLENYKKYSQEKNELEIEESILKVNIENLQSKRHEYHQKINNDKSARKSLKIYTLMFYIFLLVVSIISILTTSFIYALSIPIMTVIYLIMVADDLKTIQKCDINKVIKLQKETHIELKELEKKLEIVKDKVNTCQSFQSKAEEDLYAFINEFSLAKETTSNSRVSNISYNKENNIGYQKSKRRNKS